MVTTIVLQTMEKYDIEVKTVEMLKTVFDPEIPVNVYDLGLIYKIDVTEGPLPTSPKGEENGSDNNSSPLGGNEGGFIVNIDMTLTAPSCPAADFIMEDIHQKVSSIEGVKEVNIELVYEPEWTKDMMSEEAKLDLGFL